MSYSRNITPLVQALMGLFPAVAIIGVRQAGKTTLAKKVAPEFLYFDLERPSQFDRLSQDPEFFFKQHPRHVIFDEAQLCPELFSVLRGVIDDTRDEKGRFILTGSSSPELLEHISESLAGRIAIVELGTLKANELYQTSLSDFYQLFKEPLSKETFKIETPPLTFEQVQMAWFKGGYPEPCLSEQEGFYDEWMNNYILTYINRDLATLFPKLDKVAYRKFTTMLSELSGKTINKSDIARSIQVTEPTISDYLNIASGTFVWRSLPSFEHNVIKRIVKMPKGHIRDTGLLHHLLHLTNLEKLQASVMAGFTFEAYVIEEILKGLQDVRVPAEGYYYRTHGGAEIDLVLEGNFGLLPIEIKYGSTILGRQLRSLTEFIQEHKLPYGIVVNQADELRWLTDKIVQIPVTYL